VAAAAQVREAYWTTINAQHYDAAYAMYSAPAQAIVSHDAFLAHEQHVVSTHGANIERRVMRTTVYDNPQGMPPGIYVAFDYIGRFATTDRNCGYLILHQTTPSAPFRMVRSEQAFMDNATAATVRQQGRSADEEWAQMASNLCPGWQRDWVFQPPV
jgi:hypothetical protein